MKWHRFIFILFVCALFGMDVSAQQPDPSTTSGSAEEGEISEPPARRPFIQRIFGRRERPRPAAEQEEEPAATPGPPRPRTTPATSPQPASTPRPPRTTTPASTPAASPRATATPVATPVSTPDSTPAPSPDSESESQVDAIPAPEPDSDPAANSEEGIQMDDAPPFVEPVTPAAVPFDHSEDVVKKLRELRIKARGDKAVQAAYDKVQKATTEPEYFEARKAYLIMLYEKIRTLEPDLAPMADATEAASMRRLESHRDMMRAAFEAGERPSESAD